MRGPSLRRKSARSRRQCLKAKSVGLDGLREIRRALGENQFGLVVEGLKDAEVKSVVTRLDKHHPDLKNSSTAWQRHHLNSLADGSSAPHGLPLRSKRRWPERQRLTSAANQRRGWMSIGNGAKGSLSSKHIVSFLAHWGGAKRIKPSPTPARGQKARPVRLRRGDWSPHR